MEIDSLQVIATTLEFCGLLLAFLDMRFPKKMKQIELAIDYAGDWLLDTAKKHRDKFWYSISLSIMIFSVLIIGVGWLFGAAFPLWCWIIFWVSVGAGSSIILIALLGDFIALLNRFSAYDQAVTTLGFFLASTGLIFDLLQLFNIL